MIKTLQNTLKQDKEHLTVPKSVQDTIPIRRIWPDGLFQFGGKFSKTIRFSDINYAIASKEDKTSMFLGYSELLNALDTGSTTKITINNKRLNRRNFEQEILIPPQGDHLDGGRSEYNAMLLDKVTDSSNSMVQERYVTVSTHNLKSEIWSLKNYTWRTSSIILSLCGTDIFMQIQSVILLLHDLSVKRVFSSHCSTIFWACAQWAVQYTVLPIRKKTF